MKKSICLLLIFLSACATFSPNKSEVQKSPTPEKELKLIIPNAGWEKIFFNGIDENDVRGINKVASLDGFSKLRETILPENDFEMRVWVGFGLFGIDGFILKRTSDNWSATALKRMLCHLENRAKVNLAEPKSGWENFWQKLVNEGILTLPDSSELKKYGSGVVDGKSYVVELNKEFVYRTYKYSNPKYVKLKEAKHMVNIGNIIADEFGLESFSSESGGCKKNE